MIWAPRRFAAAALAPVSAFGLGPPGTMPRCGVSGQHRVLTRPPFRPGAAQRC